MLAICVAAAALALGCTPKIGDDCTVSTNCSTAGDRLCDITQPGGYCTVFNCEPGSCPADSVCVNFGTSLSPVAGCAPSQGNSPYQRSFCMATCGSDGDCRADYKCLKPTELNAVSAEHSNDSRVCAVPPKAAPTGTSNQVCLGSDAGAEPAEGGSASSGGAGSSAGASGGSAAGEAGEGGTSG